LRRRSICSGTGRNVLTASAIVGGLYFETPLLPATQSSHCPIAFICSSSFVSFRSAVDLGLRLARRAAVGVREAPDERGRDRHVRARFARVDHVEHVGLRVVVGQVRGPVLVRDVVRDAREKEVEVVGPVHALERVRHAHEPGDGGERRVGGFAEVLAAVQVEVRRAARADVEDHDGRDVPELVSRARARTRPSPTSRAPRR
jgi:hypothetical protein